MSILEETSKQLVEAIKDLYIKGKYELEYAIVQLNKFYSNGRITKTDFEEQCQYYRLEKERLNTIEIEEIENTANEVIEENQEIESAE